MIRPLALSLALLAAPALAAPPDCAGVDRELARLDARLRAIASSSPGSRSRPSSLAA